MWKVQTCGSLLRIAGSDSVFPSWIFTVPLNPRGSLSLPPPWAAAGLVAVKTNRAKTTMKLMTPLLALRIRVPPVVFTTPTKNWGFVSTHEQAGPAPQASRRVTA
jgi:hypothetical protein